jgi:hypothetical protein
LDDTHHWVPSIINHAWSLDHDVTSDAPSSWRHDAGEGSFGDFFVVVDFFVVWFVNVDVTVVVVVAVGVWGLTTTVVVVPLAVVVIPLPVVVVAANVVVVPATEVIVASIVGVVAATCSFLS